MSKGLVCFQAGWMAVQVLAHTIRHFPVSLLEINTVGHVVCALVQTRKGMDDDVNFILY